MSDNGAQGHLEMARDLFGGWNTKTHKMRQLKSMAIDWATKFMDLSINSFGCGFPIHIKSIEMNRELLNYKEWVDFIPTKGTGMCLKFDANVWHLGEICCRLQHYQQHPDELKEIEDEISNSCLGEKLQPFVEGMSLLNFCDTNFDV